MNKETLPMSKQPNLNVEYKVEKNGQYGDWRVVEYFDGQWNNEIDNNWDEPEAERQLKQAESSLIRLNGAMIAPHDAITTLKDV